MAWPPTRASLYNVLYTNWNELVNALSTWGGPVNGGGYALTNVILTYVIAFATAKVQAGVASAAFSLPASGAPTAVAYVGSNQIFAVLSFPDGSTTEIQDRFRLPSDWSGAIDVELLWRTTATTGDCGWQIQTAFVGDAEVANPAWNTAQNITDTSKGTTNQFNTAALASITITGAAANKEMFFKILRTGGTDSLAAAAELFSVSFKLRRTLP